MRFHLIDYIDDDTKPIGDHDQRLVTSRMAELSLTALKRIQMDQQHCRTRPSVTSLGGLSASDPKSRRFGSEVTGSSSERMRILD